jgi:tryptophan-rich sensory protein
MDKVETKPPFKTWSDFLILFFPIVVGYVTSAFCKIKKESGENVKFRPPSITFTIIWPILFLLIGFSWIYSIRASKYNYISYGILIALLSVYIILYGCKDNSQAGVYVLLFTLVNAIIIMSLNNFLGRCLFTPVMVWLLFATLLNTQQVQTQ